MEKLLKALKYVKGKIADLEDDLQHYTMVDKDKCKEFYIREDLKVFSNILENLQELQAIKETKASEALEFLEECANGMKDLPKSNWIDLAENEAELDLKIMDWVETIQFELFNGKQALTELKQIKETKASEALKCVDVLKEDGCITTLYQGKALETIRQYILKAQKQEKEEVKE